MTRKAEAPPVLDGNGNPVNTADITVTPELRAFFAGRVPAKDCPHYIAASESRAGFTRCEHC